MKKQRRHWSEPELHEARNRALKAGDPLKKFGVKAGLDERLTLTLADIQERIKWGYDFEGNPLDDLREYFPDFEWKFHGDVKAEDVSEIISQADYAWLKRPQSDYSLGIVTASKKTEGIPKRFYFVWFNPDDTEEGDWNWGGWPEIVRTNMSFRMMTRGKEML